MRLKRTGSSTCTTCQPGDPRIRRCELSSARGRFYFRRRRRSAVNSRISRHRSRCRIHWAVLACVLSVLAPGLLSAQEQKPAQSKPNILVIMGDDIGWFNPSIYHRGIMGTRRRTSTASARKARCSPTGTGSRAAPPGCGVRHRTVSDPHGAHEGWPARCGHRFAAGHLRTRSD